MGVGYEGPPFVVTTYVESLEIRDIYLYIFISYKKFIDL